MTEKEKKEMEERFEFAHRVMIATNEILEPLGLPVKVRQLENDRVDSILKKYFYVL